MKTTVQIKHTEKLQIRFWKSLIFKSDVFNLIFGEMGAFIGNVIFMEIKKK